MIEKAKPRGETKHRHFECEPDSAHEFQHFRTRDVAIAIDIDGSLDGVSFGGCALLLDLRLLLPKSR